MLTRTCRRVTRMLNPFPSAIAVVGESSTARGQGRATPVPGLQQANLLLKQGYSSEMASHLVKV